MCLGIPGQIVRLSADGDDTALVLVSGAERRVNLGMVSPGPGPGDWVLVHAGFALSTLSEEEARDTLALLREVSETFAGDLSPDAPATGDG